MKISLFLSIFALGALSVNAAITLGTNVIKYVGNQGYVLDYKKQAHPAVNIAVGVPLGHTPKRSQLWDVQIDMMSGTYSIQNIETKEYLGRIGRQVVTVRAEKKQFWNMIVEGNHYRIAALEDATVWGMRRLKPNEPLFLDDLTRQEEWAHWIFTPHKS